MAAASQAVPGEFDSRHLLQKRKDVPCAAHLFSFAATDAAEIIRLSRARLSFALGHAHAYLSALAHLVPKKRYQRFS